MQGISIIVAVGQENEIGFKNELLWHLPSDFKWFKKQTLGFPIIMGRKTFESLGKALPGRLNIVISRTPQQAEGTVWVDSPEKALELAAKENKEIFIIGGDSIYKLFLPLCNKVYKTIVLSKFEADAFFPALNADEWNLKYSLYHPKDEKHAFDFEMQILERK